jgi:hypothetical protein
MKKVIFILSIVIGFAFSVATYAAEFQVYPGAKLDDQATNEVRQLDKTTTAIYTTDDSFEKVHAFYNKIAKEYKIPGIGGQQAFFIVDGAPDIMSSKLWIKVQRPFASKTTTQQVDPNALMKLKPGSTVNVETSGIRDITAIILSEQK